ncbi:Autophagy-related protein 22 [Nakaseomyces bracarensis]|uniref:Autophagy-related protein n=1 Tax=Nakaseomyces bracarensis TaxID=273131 RepID=A0ABR4NYR7_9SACH
MSYGSVPNEERVSDMNADTVLVGTDVVKKTRSNIKGWYLYAFSSEPFVVSAVATYVPLLLERFARINGVLLYDHDVPCPATTSEKCVLGLFNGRLYVDTSSFALYVFSLSVLFQTVIVITVSGMVDMWKTVTFRSKILTLCGLVGATATIFISLLNDTQYYSLTVYYIIANCCFGVINVVGNSLLPIFVDDLVKFKPDAEALLELNSEEYSLVSDDTDSLTTLISGRGASIGYLAALTVQIISLLLVRLSPSKQDIQYAVFFVGLWWAAWQFPMYWLLNDVRASNRPPAVNRLDSTYLLLYPSFSSVFKWSSLKYGWQLLIEAFKHARLLRDVMIFLLGWFIISDSLTTINSTAILFSKTELHMSTTHLIALSITTMISAMIGAFMIPQFLSKKLKMSPQGTMLSIICWASFIPFYGILGFVFESFGLKHKFEMFALGIWYGLSMGGLSAVSRSLFSIIIPKGKESTFFSLFSITDKGSSIVGPFIIGLITDKTHNIRYSFYFLFILLIGAIPIFRSLDVERGKREAEELRNIEVSRAD